MALPAAIEAKIPSSTTPTYPRVLLAEIAEGLPVQAVGPRKTLKIGQMDAGREITAMYLHPQGLLIVRDGRKILISTSKLTYVELE